MDAIQISQIPCSMNLSEERVLTLLRVLQFGATVATKSSTQPQGAMTIPKIRMPGVRKESRIHSCVDCLGMIAVVVVVAAAADVPLLTPKHVAMTNFYWGDQL